MHKFIDYISDLLFIHDCVIIPDFGGFICNYKSAHIDESTGMISPPAKEILFNKNLKNNDGLLVNWIVCKDHISYAQATRQVELFSDELKVKLSQGKRVVWGDIGVFYTDRRFNVVFEPGDHNFLADAYGMDKIEATRISYKQEEKKEAPKEVKKERVPHIQIPSHNQMYPYMNMESKNWVHRLFKYVAAAAIVAGILFLSHLGINYWGNLSDSESDSYIHTTSISLPYGGTNPYNINHNNSVYISPDCDYVTYDPLENGFED